MTPELAAFLSRHKWTGLGFLAGLLLGGIVGRL
jgi:hypothetical protein